MVGVVPSLVLRGSATMRVKVRVRRDDLLIAGISHTKHGEASARLGDKEDASVGTCRGNS